MKWPWAVLVACLGVSVLVGSIYTVSFHDNSGGWRPHLMAMLRPGMAVYHHPPSILLNVPSPTQRNSPGKFAVSTLISLSPLFCQLAYVMYRSVRRLDPTMRYDFILMYPASDNQTLLTTNNHCRELVHWSKIGNVILLPIGDEIQKLVSQPWMKIAHTEWKLSMNRMAIWKQDQYDRILYVDADTLIYRNFDDFFKLPYDLSFATDEWTPCLNQQKMNGGMFVVKPSQHLYAAFEELLLGSTMKSCLSGELRESDQEVVNCMCGFGGSVYARTPEIHCNMLPYFTNTMPNHVQCKSYNPDDVMIVHFAGPSKPWKMWHERKRCEKNLYEATHNQSLAWFEAPERRHCWEEETALFTLWLCHYQQGSIDRDMLPERMPDCRLLHLRATPGHRSVLHLPDSDWE